MIPVALILVAVVLGAEYDLLGLAVPVPDYGLIGESNPSPGSAPAATSPVAPRPRALLYFTATWCAPCKTMRPIVERLRAEGVDVRITDVDAKPQTAAAWRAKTLPCFVVAERRGDGWHEVRRITGATEEAALREAMR